MTHLTTITTKGQVTIPRSIRKELGAVIGDKVAFVQLKTGRREATIRIISKSIVDELAGSLKSSIPYTSQDETRKLLAKERAKRYT